MGKIVLKKLVETEIKNALYKGHEGFSKLLPKLTKQVEQYNKEVKASNDSINKPIKDILEEISDENAWRRNVNEIKVDSVTEEEVKKVETLVSECKKFCKTFTDAFEFKDNKVKKSEMRNVIRHLNSALQPIMNSALKAVSHEIGRLEKLSDNDKKMLAAMESKITETCKTLKDEINRGITAEVEDLVKELRSKVQEILMLLKEINEKLKGYVNQLDEWIKKADALANEASDEANFISGKRPGFDYQNGIKKIVRELDERSRVLCSYIDEVKKELKSKVTAALKGVIAMNEAVRTDLNQVKGQLLTGLNNYVSKYVEEVQKKVKEIKGEPDGNSGLSQVVAKVKEWAEKFRGNFAGAGGSTGTDGTILSRWVKEIIESGAVKFYLGWVGLDSHKDEVKRAMTEEIKKIFNEGTDTVKTPAVDSNSMKDSLTNVKNYLSQVASKVGEKASTGQVSQFAGGIAKHHMLLSLSISPDKNLESAVEIVLKYVSAAATNLANEIDKLALQPDDDNNLGKNVDNALQVATELDSAFGTAVKKGGDIPSDAAPFKTGAPDLKANIQKTISEALDKKIGESDNLDGGKVTITQTNFDTYNRYINQETPVTSKTETDQLKGQLPEAINAIGTYAESGFTVNPTKEDLDKWSKDLKSNLESLLSAFATSGTFIKEKLTTLRTQTIGKELRQIHSELKSLQNELETGPIQKATEFLDEAQRLQQKCIQSLHYHVEQKIKQANSDVTTEARKQYVCTVKALLTEFSKKVQGELDRMPDAIDIDLNKGLKGFMKKFGEHFVVKVKELNDVDAKKFTPKSPLSHAVFILNKALGSFVHEVKTQTEFTSDIKKIRPVHDALLNLFEGLKTSEHFNHEYSINLDALKKTFQGFHPSKFGEPTTVLTQTLKEGIGALVKELDKAYVNKYEGSKAITWEGTFTSAQVQESKNIAKAFLTSIYTFHETLYTLNKGCMKGGEWRSMTCCETGKRGENPLGSFLKRSGFQIAKDDTSKEGELKFPSTAFTGETIYGKLFEQEFGDAEIVAHLRTCESNVSKKPKQFDFSDLLECLLYHTEKYNEVCHLSTFSAKKQPCSVSDMLTWLSGLTYNRVYTSLRFDALPPLLESDKPKSYSADNIEVSVVDNKSLYLNAYPNKITYDNFVTAIDHICAMSYDVLICIAGHGDAETVYGSDLCNNSVQLHYPKTGEECLSTLLDIMRRLLPPLRFLVTQCGISPSDNANQKTNQSVNLRARQTANQTPKQTANQRLH
ncbi:hypothetical protein, conserved [Babesia ovata]|uniref:Extracellular matrix-binding ebh n=1 Tax=Babesia ovata TaxID=189622 RepID=A0A2H6KJ74_9APIC|nr:uncharacterized protein BOVATA_045240 [Babesia ovata]GBE63031.1 hypothetical protein, conserved [Babesia ovata]